MPTHPRSIVINTGVKTVDDLVQVHGGASREVSSQLGRDAMINKIPKVPLAAPMAWCSGRPARCRGGDSSARNGATSKGLTTNQSNTRN